MKHRGIKMNFLGSKWVILKAGKMGRVGFGRVEFDPQTHFVYIFNFLQNS